MRRLPPPRAAARALPFALPFALLVATQAAVAQSAAPRWYKGNTHVHTRESDGNRPPEEVARWYRDHGYQFLVISDHETITDPAPLNGALGAPGRFLVVRGQEVTQQVADSSHPAGVRQAHVGAIGLARAVSPLGERGIARGTTVAATYARNLAAVRAAGGVPQVNHPNFRWSVRADDMARLPDSTLFELWNAQPRINNLGGDDGAGRVAPSTEALWDTLLTRGARLLAVGSDDAHNFAALDDAETTRPGGAWVMVRADTLTEEAIVAALRAGRFYASTGVALADVAADGGALRVEVAAPEHPRDDRRYRTRFVGRGGRTLAEVAGRSARYAFRGDEGYVRAAVTDSDGRRAWTQPVWVGPRVR